jgi:hypothetical protein
MLMLAGLCLAGCRPVNEAPTIDVFGSYFPAWIICIFLGLVATLVTRQLLLGLKLAEHLRPAPLVYLCLTIVYTFAIWLIFFED